MGVREWVVSIQTLGVMWDFGVLGGSCHLDAMVRILKGSLFGEGQSVFVGKFGELCVLDEFLTEGRCLGVI